jgi:presenilin-like A22 family membrane protease
MPNESVAHNHQISTTADGIILCENTRWVLLDDETGQELDSHGRDCQLGLRYEPIDDDWENCDGTDDVAQDWAVMENRLEPIGHVRDNDEDIGECTGTAASWVYEFPEGFEGRNILFVRDIGDSHFLIVSTQWAGMVAYPTGPSNTPDFGGVLTTTWETNLAGSEEFIAATYGAAPGDELDDDEPILVLGTTEGAVTGWQINQTGTVDEEAAFRMALDDPVRGLLLADCCGEISNDLWVIEGDELRIFMSSGLREQGRSLSIDGENRVIMALHHIENPDSPFDDGLLLTVHEGEWSSMTYVAHIPNYAFTIAGMGVMWADVLTIAVSVGLMVALLRFPEWYVVNTVGILVGAGVITILGVSFVPVLIMLFMVLAAGYDAWAVYRSKHMLELADTMIGLKLPILLVAPQDKNYSFIAEGDSVMAEKVGDEPADWNAVDDGPMPAPRPIKKGGGEAMFMGLGDVIFPGMLCISAMTFLPESSGPLGLATTTWVALCTMFGGLLGYFWLMTYVARGQPQAGLPLLNGGAILGYIVSASLFIGSGAFTFGISLF